MISNCLQLCRLIVQFLVFQEGCDWNGNPNQKLPWQHLLTIITTVFSAAHVPRIHNGYSWFYAVQVTLTTVEFVCVWAQTAV